MRCRAARVDVRWFRAAPYGAASCVNEPLLVVHTVRDGPRNLSRYASCLFQPSRPCTAVLNCVCAATLQVRPMARMQLQLEKQLRRKSPIADIVRAYNCSFTEFSLSFSIAATLCTN